jgi:hypothetical protein
VARYPPQAALVATLRALRRRVEKSDARTVELVDTALKALQELSAEHLRLRRLVVDVVKAWDGSEDEQAAVRRRVRQELMTERIAADETQGADGDATA